MRHHFDGRQGEKSMSLKVIIGLLQESNRKNDALEEELKDLKRRHQQLEQDLHRLRLFLLCDNCNKQREGEVCRSCTARLAKRYQRDFATLNF